MRTPRKASRTTGSPERKSTADDRVAGVGIAIDTSRDPENQLPPALRVEPTISGDHKRSVREIEKQIVAGCSEMGYDARGPMLTRKLFCTYEISYCLQPTDPPRAPTAFMFIILRRRFCLCFAVTPKECASSLDSTVKMHGRYS